MTKNLDSKKIKLIEKIASINSVEDIDDIEKFVKLLKLNKEHGKIFNETQNNVSIESLKKEQDFKGINREKIDELAKKLDITESIEELIEMID